MCSLNVDPSFKLKIVSKAYLLAIKGIYYQHSVKDFIFISCTKILLNFFNNLS
jgi:hypothetical protein